MRWRRPTDAAASPQPPAELLARRKLLCARSGSGLRLDHSGFEAEAALLLSGGSESAQSRQAVRTMIRAVSEGFHSSGSCSPVSTNPSPRYITAAGSDSSQLVTLKRRRRAPAVSPSEQQLRAVRAQCLGIAPGSTHIPHTTATSRVVPSKKPPAIPRIRAFGRHEHDAVLAELALRPRAPLPERRRERRLARSRRRERVRRIGQCAKPNVAQWAP